MTIECIVPNWIPDILAWITQEELITVLKWLITKGLATCTNIVNV